MNTTQQPNFRNLYAFGGKLPLDLSLSENPLGCSLKVSVALKNLIRSDFFDYPDPDCSQLKEVIADRFSLKEDNVFVANGSEAIIKLIPQAILQDSDEVIIPKLTFPMFDIASRLAGGKVKLSNITPDFDIDLEDIKKNITKRTKLIFLCNPNNPTGRTINKKNLINIISSTTAMVVVDEANIEFGGQTVIKEVKNFNNLIVLRTFSKGFGLAGFRVGFCVTNSKVVQKLKQNCQPFPVSTVAEKAALIAFSDKKFIEKTKTFINKEREFLTINLLNLRLDVIQSKANTIMVKVPGLSTDFVKKLNMKGVSVVDGAFFNFNGLNFIRVSPRLRKTNIKFLNVVREILNETT